MGGVALLLSDGQRGADGRTDDGREGCPLGKAQLFAQKEESGKGGKRRLQAHEDTERARRQVFQCDDLDTVGQGRGKNTQDQGQGQDLGPEQIHAGGGQAYRENGAAAHEHGQSHAGLVQTAACLFAEDDVERPADAGTEGKHRAQRIDAVRALAQGQQDGETGCGQDDPDEVHQAAGREHGYRQGAGEFQTDGDPQRDTAQGLVKAEVHACRGQSENSDDLPGTAGDGFFPGAHHHKQDGGGHQQAQGCGAGRAHQGKDGFGKRGAGLDGRHGDQQEQDRNER